jgi:hypothetical protein
MSEKDTIPSAEDFKKSIENRQVKETEAKLPYEDAIKKIDEIEADVTENWRANDGGLTMAASDVISLAKSLKNEIEKGERPAWVDDEKDARFDTNTGSESDLYDVAYEYWNSKK